MPNNNVLLTRILEESVVTNQKLSEVVTKLDEISAKMPVGSGSIVIDNIASDVSVIKQITEGALTS